MGLLHPKGAHQVYGPRFSIPRDYLLVPAQRPDITRERCTKPHQTILNVPIGHAVGKRGPKAPGLGTGVGGGGTARCRGPMPQGPGCIG